jgi:hypothetical protein
MRVRHWFFSAPALAALLLLGGGQASVGAEKKKDLTAFGALEAPSPEAVQADAASWAKKAGLAGAKKQQFESIWKAKDLSLTEKVNRTLLLDDSAAKLVATARDAQAPAPTAVPALIKDAKNPKFFRANLAVLYAKGLSQRRVYEEALDTLKAVKPEDVVDPAAYLFHRAVAEHAMLHKQDAQRTIGRLLDEVAEAPERYKTVGALMLLDMLTWREKDLNWVARKMDNSGRRLELARGGPITQKIQKDIVNRLEEMIKELENKKKGCGD